MAAEGGSFLRKEQVLGPGAQASLPQAAGACPTTPPHSPSRGPRPSISDLNFGCCLLLKSSKIFSPFSRSTLVVMAATSPGWSLATVWPQGPVKRGEQSQTLPWAQASQLCCCQELGRLSHSHLQAGTA